MTLQPLRCSECGRPISNKEQPYRQGDRTLCTKCVRQHLWLVSWAKQGYHATKRYCAQCAGLFRSIHKEAGRPHDYCSLRCSNTACTQTRRERGSPEGRKK